MKHKRAPHSCQFGVLPAQTEFVTRHWTLRRLPFAQTTMEAWQSIGPDNQWVYPPVTRAYVYKVAVPPGVPVQADRQGRSREAVVWTVAPTHELHYSGPKLAEKAWQELKVFAVGMLGLMHGVELQIAEWGVTGRQRKNSGGMFVARPETIGLILERAVVWYAAEPATTRRTARGALWLHNHVPSYQWEWERFSWQYTAFDSAWAIAQRTNKIRWKAATHKDRFSVFARSFGIRRDGARFARWARNRNTLVHEAIWGGVLPGHGVTKSVAKMYLDLRGFTTIALLAAVGHRSPSLRVDWRSRGRQYLEAPR